AAPGPDRPRSRHPSSRHRPPLSASLEGRSLAYHPMPKPGDSTYAIGRTLRDRIEPLIGQVYFSPECHAAYAALGFAPSPAVSNGVALPDGPAYFTSRGSLMGHVPGEVVAAAFGVFNPAAVVPSVAFG